MVRSLNPRAQEMLTGDCGPITGQHNSPRSSEPSETFLKMADLRQLPLYGKTTCGGGKILKWERSSQLAATSDGFHNVEATSVGGKVLMTHTLSRGVWAPQRDRTINVEEC